MRSVAWLFAVATLVAAGVYTIVSLARWEWNRALFFALVFVAAEVGLAAAMVLRRLARVERLVVDAAAADGGARKALRDTRGSQQRFAWLRVDPTDVVGRTNVFITLLVGGGVILSGGAWLHRQAGREHRRPTARAAARPRARRHRLPARPARRRGRRPRPAVARPRRPAGPLVPGPRSMKSLAKLAARASPCSSCSVRGVYLLREATMSTHYATGPDSQMVVVVEPRATVPSRG